MTSCSKPKKTVLSIVSSMDKDVVFFLPIFFRKIKTMFKVVQSVSFWPKTYTEQLIVFSIFNEFLLKFNFTDILKIRQKTVVMSGHVLRIFQFTFQRERRKQPHFSNENSFMVRVKQDNFLDLPTTLSASNFCYPKILLFSCTR